VSYPQLLSPEEKLADAKARLGIPTIVCICGSMRFEDTMREAAAVESLAGRVVVMPHVNTKLWAETRLNDGPKVRLDELHRAKIRLADVVLVVGNYVGDSTRAEIAYARELGKPVRFTHPHVDPERAA
jgi:nucleoside 2-deoxyribosyltransferase